MSLAPSLTKLDRKVLMTVPTTASVRAAHVSREVRYWFRLGPSEREVREILRGLAHLGYVEHRNGWWRRTALGQRLLEAP